MVKRLNASKCFRTFSDLAAKRGAASYDFEKSFLDSTLFLLTGQILLSLT